MEKPGAAGRLVLVPAPFQGHMTPMLQLGTILHSKGFSIIIAHTELNSPNPGDQPDFIFLPLADHSTISYTSVWNLLETIKAINVNCKAPLQDHLIRLMQKDELDCPTTCIIYDNLMYFAEEAASHLGLPSIVLRSANAAYMQSYPTILRILTEKCFPLPESQLEDPVPQLDVIRFKDLPFVNASEIPDLLLKFIRTMSTIRSSVAIICNTADYLEHSSISWVQQHYGVPVFSVGPFHMMASASTTSLLEEDNSCISWLDQQAPSSVIYVSLGSIANMNEEELEEMAWGLVNSQQPFLWVIRPSSADESKWIEDLPEGFREVVGDRGCIVKWAPQKKVLAHSAVGGFLSHCGWNSTLESISAGIPLICRPCAQRSNVKQFSSAAPVLYADSSRRCHHF